MAYRPVKIRPRTGEQTNGHQSFFIGVPWQIAEAIPPEQEFRPSINEVSGVLRFTPTTPPDQIVPIGNVGAALAASGVPLEQSNRVIAILRALPHAGARDRGQER